MRARERVYDFLFYIVIGTLYSFALSAAVFEATIVPVTYQRLLLLSAGFMLFFFVLFFNRWTMIGVGGAVLLAGIVVLIRLWTQDFEAAWFESLKVLSREVVLFYRGVLAYREEYGRVLPVAITGLIAFLAALNLRLEFNFSLLALLGIAVIGVPAWAEWAEWSDLRVAVLIFLFCFLVLLAKRLNLFALVKGKGKHGRNDGFALLMIPVSAVALLAGSVIPSPNFAFSSIGSPTDAPRSLFDMVGDLFGARGDSTVAYSEEGSRLGGPNERTEELIMEVKADERVYLSGSLRDTYTGSSWTVSNRNRTVIAPGGGSYQTSADSDELQSRQDYWMRYYAQPERSVTVYTATSTKVLFTPPYRREMWFGDDSFEGGNELRTNSLGALTANKTLGVNTSYGQTYTGFDFTNRYIVQVLRETDEPDPGDEMLAPFLALPDSLPERVGVLAADLTAASSSNYDKLRAIERHLAQFPYTLMPDNVPRGEDFVDYFLFTGQEGYCVYFASAMAVMGRTVGIPTRYVEGYAMPASKEENGNYRVTTLQAHAWVEAFFPGFGWVPFEPTPPSYEAVYGESPADIEPPPLPTETPSDETDGDPDETGADEPEQVDDDPANPQESSQPEETHDNSRPEPDAVDGEEQGGRSGALGAALAAILSLLAVAGLSVLFVWVMRRAYRRKFDKLESLPARESVAGYFACLLHTAAAMGYPIRRGETAHQYAERVAEETVFAESGIDMLSLADSFARAAYSKQEIAPEDVAEMKQCYLELVDRLQASKRGKLRYLVNRYLLLRF